MTKGLSAYLASVWLLFSNNQDEFTSVAFPSPALCGRNTNRARQVEWHHPQTRARRIRWRLDGSGTMDNNGRIQKDDDRNQRKKQAGSIPKKSNDFSNKKVYSLNNEIHHLRKNPNGIPLAEARLHAAVQEMLQSANSIDAMNDQLPDEVSFNAVLSSYAKNAKIDRQAAIRAEALLRRMKELCATFPHLKPTTYTYNAVLEAYAGRLNINNRSKETQRLIQGDRDSIWRLYLELKDDGLLPSTYTWNLMLGTISQDSEDWKSLEKWAHGFFHDDKIKTDSAGNVPNRQTYNTLFKVYADTGSFEQAESLLQKVVKWNQQHDREQSGTLKLTNVWYNCVFKALAATESCEGGNRDEIANRLLEEMKQLADFDGYEALQPDTSTFNHVLNVHAKSGTIHAATILLKEMERLHDSNPSLTSQCKPDCMSYNTAIKSYATLQQQMSLVSNPVELLDLAERATQIFDRMRSRTDPNIVTYNTLVNIWVTVGTRDALQKAEALFRDIRFPDSFSYSTLIHGWTRTRLPEAGYRAQNLFNEFLQLPPSRLRNDFAITTLCNSIISAYAKCGETDAPKRVESLLAQLEGRFLNGDATARPDKITFLAMIDCYAKAGIPDAEERCDILLNRMDHYREVFQLDGLEPDRAVYNAYLNALAKSQQPKAVEKAEEILTMMETSTNPQLRPDIVTYSTFLDCHTKCGERSWKRAEELLRFVEGTYRRGDATLKPNAVFYSAILQAWAKTGTIDGAEKAEELLRRNIALYEEGHEYAKPHVIVYNAVMDALARSGVENAGSRAEELLDEMESLYQSGDQDLRPSRRSFNAVILAYRKDGEANTKAEELLDRMEEMADAGRNEVRPNVVTYNTVIGAIVEDGSISAIAADRAQALLDRMEERGVRPDGRTFGLVIEAWLRRNDEKGHALAETMLARFQDQVEQKKAKGYSNKEYFYEDAVWDVINAYRKTSKNDALSAFLE